jgi:hypothetical protein
MCFGAFPHVSLGRAKTSVDTPLSMKFGPLPFNPARLGAIATLVRARRSSTVEEWPNERLAAWHEAPPKHGLPLRLEFHQLSEAFKAYKLAAANSKPRAWCRCRFRDMHELEFWFASERDRNRTAMLLQLHRSGTVATNRAYLPPLEYTHVKKVGSTTLPRISAPRTLEQQEDEGGMSSREARRPPQKQELSRTRALALVAAAIVGWVVALCSVWSSDSLHEQIANANAARQTLTAELDRERQAVGAYAELQFKIDQARTEAIQIAQQSEHARSQLAATLKDLDIAQTNAHNEEERLSDLERRYTDIAQRLESARAALAETVTMRDEAQAQLQAVEQRRAEIEQEGASVPEHVAAHATGLLGDRQAAAKGAN